MHWQRALGCSLSDASCRDAPTALLARPGLSEPVRSLADDQHQARGTRRCPGHCAQWQCQRVASLPVRLSGQLRVSVFTAPQPRLSSRNFKLRAASGQRAPRRPGWGPAGPCPRHLYWQPQGTRPPYQMVARPGGPARSRSHRPAPDSESSGIVMRLMMMRSQKKGRHGPLRPQGASGPGFPLAVPSRAGHHDAGGPAGRASKVHRDPAVAASGPSPGHDARAMAAALPHIRRRPRS